MSIINLEKCPNCGSDATLHIINPLYDDLYFVCCNKCDEHTADHNTMEGAIVEWNDNASYHKRNKVWFKDRVTIGKLYSKWLSDNGIKDCPESFVSFLQTKGWLNEKKCANDLNNMGEDDED